MGVLGLGGIGRAVADRGDAFRMRVIYSGPRRKPEAPYEYVPDVVDLARQSDYLLVACKGGSETRHLVSAAVIDALGPTGTLVNVARGSVVDEPALMRRSPTAVWDMQRSTCSREPIPRLRCSTPNVIVQPHRGSATVETRTAIGQLMIDNLSAHFARKPLLTPV
jgi:lactate dehydrogenase-like 2-hydroxyacid dehydrogenase